jgi:uncharacterized protein YlaI
MSEIKGFMCDVCKFESTMNMDGYNSGDALMSKLGFSTFKLGNNKEKHLCSNCYSRVAEMTFDDYGPLN